MIKWEVYCNIHERLGHCHSNSKVLQYKLEVYSTTVSRTLRPSRSLKLFQTLSVPQEGRGKGDKQKSHQMVIKWITKD